MALKVKTSVLAVGAVVLQLGAQAQEAAPAVPEAAAPDKIIVTGSRIARRDAESAGPMTTMTREDIRFAAPTNVGDLLQAMPNVGVSLNSNGTQGTSFGVSSINLRYLGSAEGSGNRTLVLVDGHRWVNAAGGRGFRDFVDLNTIPLGVIDSIEVLKDGASAIYGADAIAGVVNIHTKQRQEGFEVNLRAGETSRNDNRNLGGYLNWGKRFEKSSVFLSASFNDSKPILTMDRDLTRVALAPLTAPGNSPRGLYVLPGLSNNAYFGTPANFAANAANAVTRNADGASIGAAAKADDAFHKAVLPDDFYNQQTQGIYATGPQRTTGLFARWKTELSESTNLHAEALYSERKSAQLFSPVLLDIRGSNGYAISKDQAFNPFGTANGVPAANALAFSGNTFRIQRVPVEVGNRDNEQHVKMGRVLVGLDGVADWHGEWNWDATLSYSRNRATFDQFNQINFDNVYRALTSPQTCAAAPGCTPLDLFGPITPGMADYIRYNGQDKNSTQQLDFSVNLTRPLFDLEGGPLAIATGYEYRREGADDNPDAFVGAPSKVLPLVSGAAQNATSAPPRDPTSGSYHLQETYLEVSAPLLANRPLVQRLELDAALRYSDYSTVGSKTTSKLAVLYHPVAGLSLRGTRSTGFRAPSILELYQGQRQTNFPTVDPCNGGGAGQPGCAGVPSSYNQSQFNGGLTAGVVAGNVHLKPESAVTKALGFTLSPAALAGWSLTADKFKITVNDAIAAQNATQILQACAKTLQFCELVKRAPSGEVLQLTQAVVNLARVEVQGTDATLRYTTPAAGAKIDASLDLSYLQSYKTFTPQADGSVLVDERTGKSDLPRSTFPRMKAQAALRWLTPQWSAGWKARYIGSTHDVPNNAVNGGTVPATVYHDLQASYNLAGGKTSFAIGVDNVFDKQPPASAANNPINFDIYTYDVRGRYVYGRVTHKF